MNDYDEKKAKDSEEMVKLLVWLWAALVVVAVGVAVVKWLISLTA